MSYRQATETPRCIYCGGSDIHTLGCFAVAQAQRLIEAEAARKAVKTYRSESLGCRVTIPE